jgi:hypothetical protein
MPHVSLICITHEPRSGSNPPPLSPSPFPQAQISPAQSVSDLHQPGSRRRYQCINWQVATPQRQFFVQQPPPPAPFVQSPNKTLTCTECQRSAPARVQADHQCHHQPDLYAPASCPHSTPLTCVTSRHPLPLIPLQLPPDTSHLHKMSVIPASQASGSAVSAMKRTAARPKRRAVLRGQLMNPTAAETHGHEAAAGPCKQQQQQRWQQQQG